MEDVKKLIGIGEELENERVARMEVSPQKAYLARTKSFSGIEFEKWVAQSIICLEEQKPTSLITEDISEKFKYLHVGNSYDFYVTLLARLKAIDTE